MLKFSGRSPALAEKLMSEDADAVCGAAHGERSEERVNQHNGYRERRWDTRAGSIELQIPKLRQGAYFPDWLGAASSRRAGAGWGRGRMLPGRVSTRRVDGLVKAMGTSRRSWSNAYSSNP